jgi:hypothetical protein
LYIFGLKWVSHGPGMVMEKNLRCLEAVFVGHD